jgi:hypothetical protein
MNTQSPAIPQGTGVNPLAAATSLNSSRIAKPSVDIAAHKKDGFVSSVGNKELARKYGNDTASVLSPTGGAAAAKPSFNAESATGSTESVGPQDMPIVNAFNDLIAQLQALPLTMVRWLLLVTIDRFCGN